MLTTQQSTCYRAHPVSIYSMCQMQSSFYAKLIFFIAYYGLRVTKDSFTADAIPAWSLAWLGVVLCWSVFEVMLIIQHNAAIRPNVLIICNN